MYSQLGIQKTLKEASALLYRKALEKKLIRGRSIEAMITALIYTASRYSRKFPIHWKNLHHIVVLNGGKSRVVSALS